MSASITLINGADFSLFDNNDFTKIRGLAANSNGSTMYAGVNETGYGIMKSINSGVNWSVANVNAVTSVACNRDGSIVYGGQLGQGLLKSTDSGLTWNYTNPQGTVLPGIESAFGYTTDNIYQIACDGTGNKLIMTTNLAKVIYRSTDGGATWTNTYNIPNAPDNPQSPVFLSSNVDGSILYAAFNNTDNNIYKSIDLGVSWNQISTQGNVAGPFASVSSNYTGDFIFAAGSNGDLNIFYETHAEKSVLPAFNGSLVRASSSYNNGNNVMVSINNEVQSYSVTNLFQPGPIPGDPVSVPCFKDDTKILCYKNEREIYINIKDIRKGDLIKTTRNGYVPVNMIGTTKIYNQGNNLRSQNRLYSCKPDIYKELTEELIITGCHSILSDSITDEQRDKTLDALGRLMVTDGKYRLMAYIDERSEPYEKEGVFNIWHIALDNEDYYMNYGIYANGLLVETCSKRFLKELSGMTLID
jgi:hypothetical protein